MHLCALSASVALALAATNTARPAPPPPLRLGVVNSEGSATGDADAGRVATYFGKAIGRPATARVYKDYASLAADFATEKVDLAWLPPALVVPAIVAGAPLIGKVVRGASASYDSVIFARADSPITDLHKVKKATIAWVDRNSAAGFVFPAATLIKNKVPVRQVLGKQLYLGNHRAVCEAVLNGTAQLGATFADPVGAGDPLNPTGCTQNLGPEVAPKFKILLASDPIPADAIAARPGSDPALVKQLTQAALGMAQTADGKILLTQVFHGDRLAVAAEADYEAVAEALEASGRIPH